MRVSVRLCVHARQARLLTCTGIHACVHGCACAHQEQNRLQVWRQARARTCPASCHTILQAFSRTCAVLTKLISPAIAQTIAKLLHKCSAKLNTSTSSTAVPAAVPAADPVHVPTEEPITTPMSEGTGDPDAKPTPVPTGTPATAPSTKEPTADLTAERAHGHTTASARVSMHAQTHSAFVTQRLCLAQVY